MPKKPNFLGGQQNYNKSTGEYEPNLVGQNGKVVTDADGDGKKHESKKGLTFEKAIKGADNDVLDSQFGKDTPERKLVGAIKQEQDFNDPSERESAKLKEKEFSSKYDQIFDGDYQRSWGVPSFKDENDPEVLKGIIAKAEKLGDDNILENAQERLDELGSKQNKPSDKKSSRVPWSDKYSDDPTEWYFESYKDIEERILNGEIPVEFKDGEIDTEKLYEQIKGEYSDQLEDGTLEDMVYDATMDIDEKSYNKERKYRQSQSTKDYEAILDNVYGGDRDGLNDLNVQDVAIGKLMEAGLGPDEAAQKVAEYKNKYTKQQSERDKAIEQIRTITDRINSYDADSSEGYLTTDESKLIKDLAQKHKLTADDLKKIGGRVFNDYSGYGTDEFAYKEPYQLKGTKQTELPKYEEGKPGIDYDFYDDGTFTIKNIKTAHSSFEEPSVAYDNLGRFYGIDLEKVIYGKGGYEEVRDKTDFSGDIIYSESEWDKFEDWLKKTHGVDLEQIRKEKFEEYKKSHTPRKRYDWWK